MVRSIFLRWMGAEDETLCDGIDLAQNLYFHSLYFTEEILTKIRWRFFVQSGPEIFEKLIYGDAWRVELNSCISGVKSSLSLTANLNCCIRERQTIESIRRRRVAEMSGVPLRGFWEQPVQRLFYSVEIM